MCLQMIIPYELCPVDEGFWCTKYFSDPAGWNPFQRALMEEDKRVQILRSKGRDHPFTPVYEYTDGTKIPLADIERLNLEDEELTPDEIDSLKRLKVGETLNVQMCETLTRIK